MVAGRNCALDPREPAPELPREGWGGAGRGEGAAGAQDSLGLIPRRVRGGGGLGISEGRPIPAPLSPEAPMLPQEPQGVSWERRRGRL